MIDRYSIAASAAQVEAFFSVDPHGLEKPRYNAAPAQLLPVITLGSAGLSHFYWGTAPEFSKNKPIGEKIINIRVEQIVERPTIKKLLRKQRCIIPADGFYSWKKIGKKSATPYRIELKPKGLFAITGTWEEYDDEQGNMVHTFMIITVPPAPGVSDIGDRMPAMLTKEEIAVWMMEGSTDEQLIECLHPYQGKLEAFSVSPRISDVRVDDATMIIPAPPSDQHGNLTLFN